MERMLAELAPWGRRERESEAGFTAKKKKERVPCMPVC